MAVGVAVGPAVGVDVASVSVGSAEADGVGPVVAVEVDDAGLVAVGVESSPPHAAIVNIVRASDAAIAAARIFRPGIFISYFPGLASRESREAGARAFDYMYGATVFVPLPSLKY